MLSARPSCSCRSANVTKVYPFKGQAMSQICLDVGFSSKIDSRHVKT
jgi:hypothetical protein